ncbi:actin-binding protein WASF1-like [Penaeus indicus]|uniref:actin-binding protein WASF1-like n=1 Tax=Penaeus indicus TaxID=29960 RepID=UPI00300DA473
MTTAWKTPPRLPSAPSPGHKRNSPLPPRRCITTPPTVDTVVGSERAGGRAAEDGRRSFLRSGLAGLPTTMAARRPPIRHTRTRPGRLPACQAYSSPTLPPATSPSPSPPAASPHPRPAQVLQKLNASHATLPISSRGKRRGGRPHSASSPRSQITSAAAAADESPAVAIHPLRYGVARRHAQQQREPPPPAPGALLPTSPAPSRQSQ